MTHLQIEALPELRDPALIVSFAGWADAGEASTAAVRWLVRHLPARRIGSIDPEVFHVFTDTRPTVKLVDGERRITWPAHDLYLAADRSRPRDLLLLVGREPELRWRTYARELIGLLRRVGATTALSLGAYLADAPHTRPVPISGFATDPGWWERLQAQGASPSNYQGPSSFVSALHHFFKEEGIPSFSLWAAVPQYLPTTANPKAALALVRRLDALLDLGLDLSRLESASAYFERQVNEAVTRDRRFTGYLRALERRADAGTAEEAAAPPTPLPSADEIIRDLENFLRGRSSESEG